MKPGRNARCPCGSGRKYKKCCLTREDARPREIEQLEMAEWDTGEPAGWLDDDEGVAAEDELTAFEIPPLDVGTIRSVRYARGFVETLDEALEERGLQVSVWTAPDIPPAILESIEREALEGLVDTWGDPRAASPIQVDSVEIETNADFLDVKVFNRAIGLVHDDSEELRRLHRFFGVLTDMARDRAGECPLAPVQAVGKTRPVPAFGLDDALKQHRRQGGACELCGEPLRRTSAVRHYDGCAPEHDLQKGAVQDLVRLRIAPPRPGGYWLDVEARADAALEALDALLRRTWLECCGHLSRFTVGNVEYFSRGYELNRSSPPGLRFGSGRKERSMKARLGTVLPPVGGTVGYEYDFGSSTVLVITVTGMREGRIGRAAVRLLGRNTPLIWPCAICGDVATQVCTICACEDSNPFVCDTHAGESHSCGEDTYLPVVNSPRLGVCGYTGEN